ncbi:MAG: hypothetical protein M3463_16475, partial [Verrucomicrobiota bacterium]|nr:hypothetical protein [Verrucomicrobiota bacterium]
RTAFESFLPIERVMHLAGQLARDQAGRFLAGYVQAAAEASPIELAKFIEAVPAAEIAGFPKMEEPLSPIGTVCASLLGTDPRRLERWLADLDPAARAKALDEGFSRARDHFQGAQFYLDARLGAPSWEPSKIFRAIGALAREDLALATDYIERLPAEMREEARREAVRARTMELVYMAPDRIPEIDTPELAELDAATLQEIAMRRNFLDPEAALRWVARARDPHLRARLEGAILAEGKLPLDRVEQLCLARLREFSSPELYGKAVMQVVNYHAATNSQRAIAWVGRLPEGALKIEAVGKLAEEWSRLNPDAAGKWIETLAPGPQRDTAISRLVAAISSEPETAFRWAATVDDGAVRREAVARIVSAWKEIDPARVRKLIASSALTPGEKNALVPRQ